MLSVYSIRHAASSTAVMVERRYGAWQRNVEHDTPHGSSSDKGSDSTISSPWR
jgi:hypothetical protein